MTTVHHVIAYSFLLIVILYLAANYKFADMKKGVAVNVFWNEFSGICIVVAQPSPFRGCKFYINCNQACVMIDLLKEALDDLDGHQYRF